MPYRSYMGVKTRYGHHIDHIFPRRQQQQQPQCDLASIIHKRDPIIIPATLLTIIRTGIVRVRMKSVSGNDNDRSSRRENDNDRSRKPKEIAYIDLTWRSVNVRSVNVNVSRGYVKSVNVRSIYVESMNDSSVNVRNENGNVRHVNENVRSMNEDASESEHVQRRPHDAYRQHSRAIAPITIPRRGRTNRISPGKPSPIAALPATMPSPCYVANFSSSRDRLVGWKTP